MNSHERVHEFRADALGDDDATALADRIRRREVSAREVAAAAIQRLEAVDASLHPLAIRDFEQALARADQPLQGPFAGVPSLIKDNQALAGFPTGFGSAALVKPRVARENSAFVSNYLALGFNYLGKSRLPEFGISCSTEPPGGDPVPNPWDTQYSAGGSSSGSAACVASGVVPIAHGNDGGGSIRIPAACCGLVGLKPTRGRHPLGEESRRMPVNIVSEGVLTRSVRDTAGFWEHQEKLYRNPDLPEIGRVEGPGRRLRIGVITRSVTRNETHPEVVASVQECARLLESAGHTVFEKDLEIEERFADDFVLYYALLAFFVSRIGTSAMAEVWDASRLENLTNGLSSYCKRNFFRLPTALWRLRRSDRVYASLFDDCDVTLTPALSGPPAELGYLDPGQPYDQMMDHLSSYANFTPLANASGAPALSVPFGMSSGGLPIASHFFGKHGDERTLLELAFELEAARPFKRIQEP